MKKITSFLLCVCLLFTLAVPVGAVDGEAAQQTIKALGIMTGDEKGNLNLNNPVTRAEFSKMMVAASIYKDSMQENSGSSPFKDVKYTHWAADYITTVVDNKWMTGYIDGSFKPDNTITFEEATSAILKLLGYTPDDLSGTYPNAYISKFRSLKLDKDITLAQGQTLTRNHCMYIFYNLMGAATKDGTVYGTTLGYSINSSGEVDYNTIVNSDIEGPYVLAEKTLSSIVPFSLSGAAIYRNSSLSSASAVSSYDVIYYNSNIKTVWVYSSRAIGIYTAASPSLVSPDTVTVAGNSYSLSTSAAKQKLSASGEFAIGDTLALLLGMDGSVVDVISASKVDGSYYGVITASGLSTYSLDSSKSNAEHVITVACTDGVSREFVDKNGSYKVGGVVMITFSNGELTLKGLSSSNLQGTVNALGSKLGDYNFASGAEIMDVSTEGGFGVIYPSRIAGAKLERGDIYYYQLNENKEITHLILRDVTGDFYNYGILTSVKNSGSQSGTSISGSYEYIINGTNGALSTSGMTLSVSQGPAIFFYENGKISTIKNLNSIEISELSAISAVGGNKQYKIADNVQVYLSVNGSYSLTSLSAIDTTRYTLRGYYETGFPAGGSLRVITASQK